MPGGWVCYRAQPEEATWPLLHPADFPPMGRIAVVRCNARKVAVKAEGIDGLDRAAEAGFVDVEHHLNGGKELEFVREVDRYRSELAGLASTYSVGSGTILLDMGWTLFSQE